MSLNYMWKLTKHVFVKPRVVVFVLEAVIHKKKKSSHIEAQSQCLQAGAKHLTTKHRDVFKELLLY